MTSSVTETVTFNVPSELKEAEAFESENPEFVKNRLSTLIIFTKRRSYSSKAKGGNNAQ